MSMRRTRSCALLCVRFRRGLRGVPFVRREYWKERSADTWLYSYNRYRNSIQTIPLLHDLLSALTNRQLDDDPMQCSQTIATWTQRMQTLANGRYFTLIRWRAWNCRRERVLCIGFWNNKNNNNECRGMKTSVWMNQTMHSDCKSKCFSFSVPALRI